jgi:hypothetical protein
MPPTTVACAQHPAVDAVHYCSLCQAPRCDACVKLLGDGRTAQCAKCGGLATPLARMRASAAPAVRPESVAKPLTELWQRLPEVPRYLAQRARCC